MTTTITLEIELEVEFSHSTGSPADYWHPGDPDQVAIKAIRFSNHIIPLTCFSADAQGAIEEAAFAEAGEYEPDYD